MSAAKHTPGKWRAEGLTIWARYKILGDEEMDGDFAVARVTPNEDDPADPEALADARLIAAAPTLASALLDVLAMIDRESGAVALGRAKDVAANALAALRAAGVEP